MSDPTHDRAAAEQRLWKELQDHNTGMLGLTGGDSRQHFQPMTAFVEPETRQLWFFTYRNTDLAEAVGAGQAAMFVFQLKDFQACLGGELALDHDEARMDKYWNAVVAAWYPQGKADPRLTLLRLRAEDAQVWISHGGPVRFAWEVVKANATHTTPDVGERANLNFN